MERRLKERLTGAAILVMVGVIFIPMILDDTVRTDTRIEETNIPKRPPRQFDSRIVPLDEPQPEAPAESAPGGKTGPEKPAAGAVEEPAEKPDQTAAAPEPEKPAAKSEKPAAKSEQPAPKPKPEAPQPAAGSKTETATAAPAQGDKPEPESNPAKPGSRGLPAWVVQIGSFSQEDNARGLIKKLRAAGHAAFIEKLHRDGKTIYRVRVGPELLRSDANELKNKLDKELKMDTMVLQYP